MKTSGRLSIPYVLIQWTAASRRSDNVWLHNTTIEKQLENLLSELHANLAKNIEQGSIDEGVPAVLPKEFH